MQVASWRRGCRRQVVHVEVTTNFGRKNESRRYYTLLLPARRGRTRWRCLLLIDPLRGEPGTGKDRDMIERRRPLWCCASWLWQSSPAGGPGCRRTASRPRPRPLHPPCRCRPRQRLAAGAAAPVPAATPPATQPAPEPEPPKPVLRIYKVWDLIDAPAAPAPENSAIPPTRLYEPTARTDSSIYRTDTSAAPPAHARPSIGSLAAILRDAIHFDEEVSIQSIEGMFLVTALPDSHKKIEQFLGAVRKELASRLAVTIQATWVAVDDDKAAKVPGPAAAPPRALSAGAPSRPSRRTSPTRAPPWAWKASACRLAAGRCQDRPHRRPAGRLRQRRALRPMLLIVQWGPVLEVKARPVGRTRRSAGVELDSVLSEPNQIVPKALRAAGAAVSTSRPGLRVQLPQGRGQTRLLPPHAALVRAGPGGQAGPGRRDERGPRPQGQERLPPPASERGRPVIVAWASCPRVAPASCLCFLFFFFFFF